MGDEFDVPTRLNNLDSTTDRRSVPDQQEPFSLPADYNPRDNDICCGRGKRNWNHQGNVYFRNLIQANVDRYIEAPSKTDKTSVVLSIVDEVRKDGAYFVKQDDAGRWYDIGDAQAREKVGHSLRDQVTAMKKTRRDDEGSIDDPVRRPGSRSPTPPRNNLTAAVPPASATVKTAAIPTMSGLSSLAATSAMNNVANSNFFVNRSGPVMGQFPEPNALGMQSTGGMNFQNQLQQLQQSTAMASNMASLQGQGMNFLGSGTALTSTVHLSSGASLPPMTVADIYLNQLQQQQQQQQPFGYEAAYGSLEPNQIQLNNVVDSRVNSNIMNSNADQLTGRNIISNRPVPEGMAHGYEGRQQQQQQQRQTEQTQQQYQELTRNALQQHTATQNMYASDSNQFMPQRRTSLALSDHGDQEVRRDSRESNQILQNFGRRPSWRAMSINSSLTSQLVKDIQQLQQQFGSDDEDDGFEDEVMSFVQSLGGNERRRSTMSLSFHDSDRRTSGMSVGSFGDFYRSSIRRSSVAWVQEMYDHFQQFETENNVNEDSLMRPIPDRRESTLEILRVFQESDASQQRQRANH